MIRMKWLAFSILSVISIGCSTQNHASSPSSNGKSAADLEKLAEQYRYYGQFKQSSDIYRQLISIYPKHIRHLKYQHEILINEIADADILTISSEMIRTIELQDQAREENFEGATPETLKFEHDALEQNILFIIGRYWRMQPWSMDKSDPNRSKYLSYLQMILDSYLKDYSDSEEYCLAQYLYADYEYAIENYEAAANGYTQLLDSCSKLADSDNADDNFMYRDAAHGALVSKLKFVNITDCSTFSNGNKDTNDMHEHPMPVIHSEIIKAAERYNLICNKEQPIDINADYSIKKRWAESNCISGKIYYLNNHYEEANQIFNQIIQIFPESKEALVGADYIVQSYRSRKQYTEMKNEISNIMNNALLMDNKTPLMPELKDRLNKYLEEIP